MSRIIIKRLFAGLMCLVMMFTLAFALVDVRAEETMSVYVSTYGGYARKGDSNIFEKMRDQSLKLTVNMSASQDEIIDAVRTQLDNLENVSDTMTFNGWNISITSDNIGTNPDGSTYRSVYAKAGAEYSGSRESTYEISTSCVERYTSAPIYYDEFAYRSVSGLIYSAGDDNTVKEYITQEVGKIYSDSIIDGAGFRGWKVTEFDKTAGNMAGKVKVEPDYSKVLTNIRANYSKKDNRSRSYMTYAQCGIITDGEPTESDLESAINNMNITHDGDVIMSGWTYENKTEENREFNLTCERYYVANPLYDKYPLYRRNLVYANTLGETIEKEIPDGLYAADKRIIDLIYENSVDRRSDTEFVFKNGHDLNKEMTVRESISWWTDGSGVKAMYSDLQLIPFSTRYISNGEMKSEKHNYYMEIPPENSDQAFAFMQQKGIISTVDEYNNYYRTHYNYDEEQIEKYGATEVGAVYNLGENHTDGAAPAWCSNYWNSSHNSEIHIAYWGAAYGDFAQKSEIGKKESVYVDVEGRIYDGVTYDDAIWTSSDTSIATVEPTGDMWNGAHIYGVSPGTVTITVQLGDYTATREITVVGNSSDPEPTPTPDPEPTPTPDPEPTPTPDPDPDPEPTPTPTPTPGQPQNPEEYTDPITGEVIVDKIIVPQSDWAGTHMTKEADGSVTVKDSDLGEAKDISPAVFAEGQVYRLYNPNTGEHFYTKNPEERDILALIGWSYEAEQTSKAISSSDEGAAPVYRVFNPNTGLHHYTTNKEEVTWLKSLGWNFEGISLYAYDKDSKVGTPTYRVYSPVPDENGKCHHIYTADAGEVFALVMMGYNDEGIAWRMK